MTIPIRVAWRHEETHFWAIHAASCPAAPILEENEKHIVNLILKGPIIVKWLRIFWAQI